MSIPSFYTALAAGSVVLDIPIQRAFGLLWQDAAKTTPAIAHGDPVRVATCPISGIDWTATSDATRPVLDFATKIGWTLKTTKASAHKLGIAVFTGTSFDTDLCIGVSYLSDVNPVFDVLCAHGQNASMTGYFYAAGSASSGNIELTSGTLGTQNSGNLTYTGARPRNWVWMYDGVNTVQAQNTNTVTAAKTPSANLSAVDSGRFWLGAFGNGTFPIAARYQRVVVTHAGQYEATRRFLSAQATSCLVVVDGNSLSVGTGTVNPIPFSTPLRANLRSGFQADAEVLNLAVNGQYLDNGAGGGMLFRGLTAIDPVLKYVTGNPVCIFSEVTNQVGQGTSSAGIYAQLKQYGDDRKSAHSGCKRLHWGPHPWGMGYQDYQTIRTGVVNLIMADCDPHPTITHCYIPKAGVTWFDLHFASYEMPEADPEDVTTYFQSDKTHLRTASYTAMEPYFRDAVEWLLT